MLTLLAIGLLLAGCGGGDDGQTTVELNGEAIEVLTYRPDCEPRGLMFVFHGNGRDAGYYRDAVRDVADRACLALFVPRFDKERFPAWRYQMAGVSRAREIQARSTWTASLALRLVAWARERDDLGGAPVYLVGHSAGGQFLSRLAAYLDVPRSGRLVVMSPGSHVMPSFAERAPYGLAGLEGEANARQRLRAYLAQPLTIYIGDRDTGRRGINSSKAGGRQGDNRLERARYAYQTALRMADKHGLTCNWTLVEAKGVGHSGKDMMAAPEVWDALGLPAP